MDVDLLPSEQVVWRGEPARYPVFERVDRFFLPLWCFVAGIAVYAAGFGPPPRSVIGHAFPVVAAVVLAWFLVARYGLRQLTLRSTEYVITNQRFVVLAKPFGTRTEQSVYLAQVEPPFVRPHADGLGTITFGAPSSFGTVPGTRPLIALEWIADVDHVRDLITAARSEQP